jgi:type VI protein secretion system component VasF
MKRLRLLSLGGAAGAASDDDATAAALPTRRWRLGFDKDAREALRLPVWVVGCNFLVCWAAFLELLLVVEVLFYLLLHLRFP